MRLACALCLVAAASIARADTPSARALYDRATTQFRLGRFVEAAQTYEQVYELHHDPAILYNVAQSYRLGNNPEKALFFYRSYLSSVPDASNRVEVNGRIRDLEQLIASEHSVKNRPPNEPANTRPFGPEPTPSAPTPPPETTNAPPSVTPAPASLTATAPPKQERTPVYKKWWLWTAVGVVAVGVGVGLGVGLGRASSPTAPTQLGTVKPTF